MTSPTLQKIREERKARHARFRAAAIPEPPPPPKPWPSSQIAQTKLWWLVKAAEAFGRAPLPEPLTPLRPVEITAIINEVAKYYDRNPRDLISHRRIYTRHRQVAIYLSAKLTFRSFGDIGRMFDHRDRSTIIYSVHKMEGLIRFDPELRREVEEIRARLEPA